MVAEQMVMENLTSTDTAAPAAMAESQPERIVNTYETALKNLGMIYDAVTTGNLREGITHLITNLKEVYGELLKDQLEAARKHREVVKDLESNHAAVITLEAHNTAHASLLAKHDGLLDHNRGAQGVTKSYGGILESRAVGGLTNVGKDNGSFKNLE